MKKKIKLTPKRKELINNLSQTILKESKKAAELSDNEYYENRILELKKNDRRDDLEGQ